ncbi:hypothetical protein ACQW5G_03120 [Fructilactobacillus sp. Tb1]|uniref:hypothetical protein n=1 Tax=Fructilactobacillus sp. Tb1 TaxID=3422304 RepID=UPI003D294526
MKNNKKIIQKDIDNRFNQFSEDLPEVDKHKKKPWLTITVNILLAIIVLAGVVGSFFY